MNNLMFFVNRNWIRDSVDVYIREQNLNNGMVSYVKEIVMQTMEPSLMPNDEPEFSLSTENAQRLMNDLWNLGIRPSDTLDRSEVVNAKNKHIIDLEKILDAFINYTKPETK